MKVEKEGQGREGQVGRSGREGRKGKRRFIEVGSSLRKVNITLVLYSEFMVVFL